MVHDFDECYPVSVLSRLTIIVFFVQIRTRKKQQSLLRHWVTDGVDRCRVGFLPRHCVRKAEYFDGRLVQVVTMCANSENPRHRQFARWNRGACYAADIATILTGTVGNNGQVLTMQERIDSIASIASYVFKEGEEIDKEEDTKGTETI